MSKLLSDQQIRSRKKIQAATSIAGGTLGLTALALRGGAAAKGTGKIGQALQRTGRIKQNAKMAEKLKDSSTAVTTAGAGLGGLSAFNFASYTKAEARKRGPVRKSKSVVEIFKAAPQQQKPGIQLPPQLQKVKPMAMPPKAPAMNGGAQPQMGGPQMPQRPNVTAPKVGGSMQAKPTMPKPPTAGKATTPVKQPKAPVSKKDWMNITEHQRRARDSRRTRQRAGVVTGFGLGAAGLALAGHPQAGNQARAVASTAKTAAKIVTNKKVMPEFKRASVRYLGNTAKANPYGTAALGGGAVAAGGAATAAGARLNEKRHDRAIARQRKARVNKSVSEIFKAYDPERNRQRRLDHYSTGAAGVSGAAAAGAGLEGAFTARHARAGAAAAKLTTKSGKPSGAGAIKALAQYKSAAKHGGKALGFGAAAVGAGIASDRIRSYKKGKGRSYSQLRMISS